MGPPRNLVSENGVVASVTTIIVILSIIALFWLVLWISPVHRVGFRDALSSATAIPEISDWPSVTVVVPARNEADELPKTIPTICAMDYPGLRVVVVDDQSDDATPAVLEKLKSEHANLIVVRAADRPAGWCGKPWAVTQGVAHANTDLTLFTDADILFHPLALRQAVRLMQAGNYDCVSLFPHLILESKLERLGLAGLVTVLMLMFPTGLVNRPKSSMAMAAGGFILVRRLAYERIGGHESVKSQIIEDVNLARKLKASGAVLHSRFTTDLCATRMYEGFDDLWEGLSKNAYAGMEYQPRKFWVGTIVGLLIAVLPPIYLTGSLVIALATFPANPKLWTIVGLSAAINLFMILIHARTVRQLKLSPIYGLLLPASAALYLLIAMSSFYQHHFKGGNVWKGRRYDREMLLDNSQANIS
jgi:hopene-associated glycosyltransferase HpnB